MPKDYYAVLGISRGADTATIHSAFRALARRYHPDAGTGSSSGKFREALEAYQALSDPQRRRQHDIDLGWTTQESRSVAEPLFRPRPASVHRNGMRTTSSFDDLFAEIIRFMEAELEFPLRLF